MSYVDIKDEKEYGMVDGFEYEAKYDMEDNCNICHGSSKESGRGYSGCGRVIEPNECVVCTNGEYCCECMPEWEDRKFCDEHKKEYLNNDGLVDNRDDSEAYWRATNGIEGSECESAPDGDCESCGESGDFMYSTCPSCFKEHFM